MKTGRPPRHGMTGTLIHNTWLAMISRVKHGKGYKEKKLKISKEWRTFENFFRDMGGSFERGLTLDRVNNSEGYSKENCRWATRTQQQRNRGLTIKVFYGDREWAMADLAETHGIPYATFRSRLKEGWSIKNSIETPVLTAKECGIRSAKSSNHVNNKKKFVKRTNK